MEQEKIIKKRFIGFLKRKIKKALLPTLIFLTEEEPYVFGNLGFFLDFCFFENGGPSLKSLELRA